MVRLVQGDPQRVETSRISEHKHKMAKQAVNPNYTPVAHPATPFRTFNEYVPSTNLITAHSNLTI
jgi:hypothetical protein